MTFDQWWDKEDMDSVPHNDRTFGEVVWQEAREDLLREQRARKTKKREQEKTA